VCEGVALSAVLPAKVFPTARQKSRFAVGTKYNLVSCLQRVARNGVASLFGKKIGVFFGVENVRVYHAVKLGFFFWKKTRILTLFPRPE
jgi:hypothetical protein